MGKRRKKSFQTVLKKRNKSTLSSLNTSDDRNPDTYICVHCGFKKGHISFDELPNGKCPRRNDGGVHFWIECEKAGEKRVKKFLQSDKPIDTEYMRYVAECYEMSGMKEEAIEWYKRAAKQGNIHAMLALAEFYKEGRIIPVDMEKAIFWYERAAAAGDANTMLILACIYETGVEVPQNLKKAEQWYRKLSGNMNGSKMDKLGELGLARVYERKGEKEKALRAYQKLAQEVTSPPSFIQPSFISSLLGGFII